MIETDKVPAGLAPGGDATKQLSGLSSRNEIDHPVTYTPEQPSALASDVVGSTLEACKDHEGNTGRWCPSGIGPGSLLDEDWRNQWIGRRLAPEDLDLRSLDGAFLLPPTLVNRLVEASEITGWSGRGYARYPIFAGELLQLARNLLCHAHYMGWSPERLQELGLWIGGHLYADNMADWKDAELAKRLFKSDVQRELVNVAVWLVDGGPPPWKLSDEYQYERAPDRPKLPTGDIAEYLEAVDADARRSVWRGRTGGSDRAVFLYLVEHGLRGPSVTMTPLGPHRTISEATTLTRATVRIAISRLMASGHLAVAVPADGLAATSYIVRWPVSEDRGAVIVPCVTGSKRYWNRQNYMGRLTHPGHPAFHRSCLGQTGYRLLEALANSQGFRTDEEWWTAAGIQRRTFYEHKPGLTRLNSSALAERRAEGWRLAHDWFVALDRIAEGVGAVDLVARRRDTSARERLDFPIYLARRAGVDLDRFEILDTSRTIDRRSGEIIATSAVLAGQLPDRQLEPVRSDRADPNHPVPLATMGSRDPRPAHCRACGRSTTSREPVSGLPWCRGCLIPEWLARIELASGHQIPDHLIKPKPRPDWGEFGPPNQTPNRKELPDMNHEPRTLGLAS